MILLGGFTLCMSYTVGVVCAVYQASGQGIIVLQALLLTAAVFLSLTTYAHVTKKDFSWMGGALFAGLMILIVELHVDALRRDLRRRRPHRLRADRRAPLLRLHPLRHEQPPPPLRPRRHVEASIALYLDIVNLFLYLLEILRMLQGGDN